MRTCLFILFTFIKHYFAFYVVYPDYFCESPLKKDCSSQVNNLSKNIKKMFISWQNQIVVYDLWGPTYSYLLYYFLNVYKQICFHISCQFWLDLWGGGALRPMFVSNSVSSQRLAVEGLKIWAISHLTGSSLCSFWNRSPVCSLSLRSSDILSAHCMLGCTVEGKEIPRPFTFMPIFL